MPIAPISNINFKQNSNINFGNKRKEQNVLHNSGTLKAVPLATLIALSPINIAKASNPYIADIPVGTELVDNTNIIKTKIFNTTRELPNGKKYNYVTKFNFIDTDGNTGNYEKVEVHEVAPELKISRDADVKEFSAFKFDVVASDGNNNGTFTLYNTFTENQQKSNGLSEFEINDKEICEFLKTELASSRNNNAVKYNKIIRKIHPDWSLDLQNGAGKPTITTANARNYSKYKQVDFDDFEGSNGKYKFKYYSMSENEDKIDIVSLSKDGQPEMSVVGVYPSTGIYSGNKGHEQKFDYGIVVLMDANMKYHYLSDRNVAVVLYNLINDVNAGLANNTYKTKILTKEYDVTDAGVLVPFVTDNDIEQDN